MSTLIAKDTHVMSKILKPQKVVKKYMLIDKLSQIT